MRPQRHARRQQDQAQHAGQHGVGARARELRGLGGRRAPGAGAARAGAGCRRARAAPARPARGRSASRSGSPAPCSSPNGSSYCSSPALCAARRRGQRGAHAAASAARRRRRPGMRAAGYEHPCATSTVVSSARPLRRRPRRATRHARSAPVQRRRDRRTAIGLAAATMAANLVAVVFTVIFTRLLGADGYGSLAALLNLTRDPVRPRLGAAGRRGARGHARPPRPRRRAGGHARALDAPPPDRPGRGHAPSRSWRASRSPRCSTSTQEWAAAGVARDGRAVAAAVRPARAAAGRAAPTARSASSIVLEALGRLAVGLAFVGLGLGVTGAYLGTPPRSRSTAVVLELLLRRRLGPADRRRAASTRCARSRATPRSRSPR